MINKTIILLLPLYLEDDVAYSLRYDIYFYKPLQKMFSRVIPYDYHRQLAEIGVKGVNEKVIELVKQEHPKYVLCLATRYEFLPSTFDMIRKEGSIVIKWFFDDEHRFDDYSKWWVPHLDYCVTHDIEAVPKYRALGARVIHAFPCEGIPINRDWSNIEEKYDVSFVGKKPLPGREQYINEIRKRSIPVHVLGDGWGRYLPFEEMIDICRTTKINLHFSRVVGSTRLGLKGRISIVCLAGGFLLAEYVPGIEKYFEIDREIVCFKNVEEMIDKINYYLNHDEERQAIAQAGWKRAINEYTPFHMLSRVFGEIEKGVVVNGKETHPQELKIPRRIRNLSSHYHFQWGKIFLEANHKGLWKDALALSLSYNPFNMGAWYYHVIGFFPPFIRTPLFKLYNAYRAAVKVYMRLRHKLLCWADSIPYLRDVKRNVVRRFS